MTKFDGNEDEKTMLVSLLCSLSFPTPAHLQNDILLF